MFICPSVNIRKIFYSDFSGIIFLFLLSAFFVYFLPVFFTRIFFIVLLLFFWRSKRDYFWFVFLFIIIEQPAGFFSGIAAADQQRLPIYTITSGVSITYYEIFIFTAFIKAVVKGKRRILFIQKPLQWLLIYLLIILFFSFLYGMNVQGIIRAARIVGFWSLFISFPFLLKNKEEFIMFCELLFPFVFLIFIGQIYELINGVPIIGIFKPIDPGWDAYSIKETENITSVARIISAPFLDLFCFISSLFILFSRDKPGMGKFYLVIVSTLCFLSILLSATRGWVLAYSLMIFFIFLKIPAKQARMLGLLVVPFLLFFTLYTVAPIFRIQIENALMRINTMKYLVEGDITLGGTQQRTTMRSESVMTAFYKNPLAGWGFSYKGTHDAHVGNQNLLQSTGIIGYSLFLYFWWFYLFYLNKVRKRISPGNPYKMSFVVLLYGFISIFVIHSTSTQMFGYDLGFSAINKIFFLVVFFVFSDVFIKEAINVDFHENKISKSHLSL